MANSEKGNPHERHRLTAIENYDDQIPEVPEAGEGEPPVEEVFFLARGGDLSKATGALRLLVDRLVDVAEDKLDNIADLNCSFESKPDGSASLHFRAYRRQNAAPEKAP